MPKKLIIIHFFPIENYPPILNLITILDRKGIATLVLTTKSRKEVDYSFKFMEIKRFGYQFSDSKKKWIDYLYFVFTTLLILLKVNPTKVLYYEKVSSLPVSLYKQFTKKNFSLFIHYHEYTSKNEVLKSNFFVRWIHKLEKKLYSTANWISHTNPIRLQKFIADEQLQESNKFRYLPNYPLASWGKENEKYSGQTLKLIYVGYAADSESTYISELIKYLSSSKKLIDFDIYCHKDDSVDSNLLGRKGKLRVNLYQSVPYEKLAEVISDYHVGVIFYKARSDNYVYNAPNKLFEYLNCGLDVWFPKEMEGIKPYESNKSPKVVALDYCRLKEVSINDLLKKSDGTRELNFNAEAAYEPLIKKLKA